DVALRSATEHGKRRRQTQRLRGTCAVSHVQMQGRVAAASLPEIVQIWIGHNSRFQADVGNELKAPLRSLPRNCVAQYNPNPAGLKRKDEAAAQLLASRTRLGSFGCNGVLFSATFATTLTTARSFARDHAILTALTRRGHRRGILCIW